jgi:hypothetical protein
MTEEIAAPFPLISKRFKNVMRKVKAIRRGIPCLPITEYSHVEHEHGAAVLFVQTSAEDWAAKKVTSWHP